MTLKDRAERDEPLGLRDLVDAYLDAAVAALTGARQAMVDAFDEGIEKYELGSDHEQKV